MTTYYVWAFVRKNGGKSIIAQREVEAVSATDAVKKFKGNDVYTARVEFVAETKAEWNAAKVSRVASFR
jgi:hypothetical protein